MEAPRGQGAAADHDSHPPATPPGGVVRVACIYSRPFQHWPNPPWTGGAGEPGCLGRILALPPGSAACASPSANPAGLDDEELLYVEASRGPAVSTRGGKGSYAYVPNSDDVPARAVLVRVVLAHSALSRVALCAAMLVGALVAAAVIAAA